MFTRPLKLTLAHANDNHRAAAWYRAPNLPEHSCMALVCRTDGVYEIDFIILEPNGARTHTILDRGVCYKGTLRAAWDACREYGVPLIRMYW